jgi:hypothetical protein
MVFTSEIENIYCVSLCKCEVPGTGFCCDNCGSMQEDKVSSLEKLIEQVQELLIKSEKLRESQGEV